MNIEIKDKTIIVKEKINLKELVDLLSSMNIKFEEYEIICDNNVTYYPYTPYIPYTRPYFYYDYNPTQFEIKHIL
jgi:hypothetical protein